MFSLLRSRLLCGLLVILIMFVRCRGKWFDLGFNLRFNCHRCVVFTYGSLRFLTNKL